MSQSIYQSTQTQSIINHIFDEYNVSPEFLWPERSPGSAVFRNPHSRKWFGIVMTIPGTRLGLETEDIAEIIDLKFDKGAALDFAACTDGIFPAYHMNKRNWITVILDNTLSDSEISHLIEKSFLLSDKP